MIPESVEEELRHQASECAALRLVLDASWIKIDRSGDIEFLTAFARYEERLAVGRKNRGECGVLALGATRGYELVVDDLVARAIAGEDGLSSYLNPVIAVPGDPRGPANGSAGRKHRRRPDHQRLYLPFRRGEFRRWATQEGSIDY